MLQHIINLLSRVIHSADETEKVESFYCCCFDLGEGSSADSEGAEAYSQIFCKPWMSVCVCAGWWCFWQFTLLSSLQFFGFTSPQTASEVTVSSSPLMLLFIKNNVSVVVGCSTAVRMLTFCLSQRQQNSCYVAFSIHQNKYVMPLERYHLHDYILLLITLIK